MIKKSKKIKLNENIGNAIIGDIFVSGLYEVPYSLKIIGFTKEDVYWLEDRPMEEYRFLLYSTIKEHSFNELS